MIKAPVEHGSRARHRRGRTARLGISLLLVSPLAWAQPADPPPDTPPTETPTETPADAPAAEVAPAPEAAPVPVPPPPPEPAPAPATTLWNLTIRTGPSDATVLHQPASSERLPPVESDPGGWSRHVELRADLLNAFLFRNDSDFDRSKPVYDEDGQSVGAFATIFRPMLTLHAAPNLRLYYEAELGLNYWSKNNPDQADPQSPDVFVLKHRQVYAEGDVAQNQIGFRVGYQFFSDPTELFLGHWIGAASAWYNPDKSTRIGAFVGQVPDQTYEGINVEENNFKRDIFVFGPRADFELDRDTRLSTAVVGLYDTHLVDRRRWVAAPAARFDVDSEGLSLSFDGVMQLGKDQQAALGNADQTIFAWALQAHGSLETQPLIFDANALVLSSDDAKDGNENNGTFLYSSRSRSATILLTEDETRNWYDQIDRRAGAYRGGFWEHRAGLVVADIKATWVVSEVFRPALVLGGAAVLQKHNALNNNFVGVESDLDLELRASESLSAHLIGGALIPGKAASALVNRIDRTATDPIFAIQASMLARY